MTPPMRHPPPPLPTMDSMRCRTVAVDVVDSRARVVAVSADGEAHEVMASVAVVVAVVEATDSVAVPVAAAASAAVAIPPSSNRPARRTRAETQH